MRCPRRLIVATLWSLPVAGLACGAISSKGSASARPRLGDVLTKAPETTFGSTSKPALVQEVSPPQGNVPDEATRNRLLKIVPIGSTVIALEAEARAHGWRVSSRDDRPFKRGLAHYFGGECRHQGGVNEKVIVAEYGMLTTTVETVWLFNQAGRLAEVCLRTSTDAP